MKRAVVNEEWERDDEIVMCIYKHESNQLIKYSSLVTHRLRPKSKNRMPSFSLSCSINCLAIIGGSGLLNEKLFICRACSTHEHLMEFSRCSLSANSIDVHQETERSGTDDLQTGVLC